MIAKLFFIVMTQYIVIKWFITLTQRKLTKILEFVKQYNYLQITTASPFVIFI